MPDSREEVIKFKSTTKSGQRSNQTCPRSFLMGTKKQVALQLVNIAKEIRKQFKNKSKLEPKSYF